MNEIFDPGENGLMDLPRDKNGELVIPDLIEKDIFLFDTHVAGITYIPGIMDLEPHLDIGDRLHFFREPDNLYDPNAIVVKTDEGIKIGYIPKKDNVVFSRLMDAGKLLFGKITDKELVDERWLKISLDLFMHEEW